MPEHVKTSRFMASNQTRDGDRDRYTMAVAISSSRKLEGRAACAAHLASRIYRCERVCRGREPLSTRSPHSAPPYSAALPRPSQLSSVSKMSSFNGCAGTNFGCPGSQTQTLRSPARAGPHQTESSKLRLCLPTPGPWRRFNYRLRNKGNPRTCVRRVIMKAVWVRQRGEGQDLSAWETNLTKIIDRQPGRIHPFGFTQVPYPHR